MKNINFLSENVALQVIAIHSIGIRTQQVNAHRAGANYGELARDEQQTENLNCARTKLQIL